MNVSYDALAIFPDTEDKKILQNLTSFNRSFKDKEVLFSTYHYFFYNLIFVNSTLTIQPKFISSGNNLQPDQWGGLGTLFLSGYFLKFFYIL